MYFRQAGGNEGYGRNSDWHTVSVRTPFVLKQTRRKGEYKMDTQCRRTKILFGWIDLGRVSE